MTVLTDATTHSLADKAYDLLREDILSGALAPDQPLRLEVLRERYGVSYSPIREALTRLASERLVSQSSQRGFRTVGFSKAEMWDVLRARILIETEALRLSIAEGGDLWEGQLAGALRAFTASAQRASASVEAEALYEQRHNELHHALISGCNSPVLLRLAQGLFLQSERYRRPHLEARSLDSASVIQEHEALCSAALERDSAMAAALLARHYTNTGRFIEGLLSART